MAAGSFGALVVALVINMPWTTEFTGSAGWTAVVGVPPTTARGLGLNVLARMGVGGIRLGVLALVLYVPVFAAPLVGKSWRFLWAVRGAALVATFGALAILDDRAALPFRMPEPGVMLVPVGVGIAIAAGCVVASFDIDVMAGSFGWRQPLAVLSMAALGVGVIPGVLAVANGHWNMPKRTLANVLNQFPTSPTTGDYRILWIGDPRAMPAGAWTYQPGVAYSITDDGQLTLEDRYASQPSVVEQEVAQAVRQMAGGFTLRGGRLLAQYGIRYVVVPLADGFNGTISSPLAPPKGLTDVLDDQLDLASPLTRPPNYLVYENTAYSPTRAVLTGPGADASRQAGGVAVAQSELSGSTPWATGSADRGDAVGRVSAGTLHVAVPYDSNWKLTVNGAGVAGRRAFGSTLAFDVPAAGTARLTYETGVIRPLWALVQLSALLALAVLGSRVRSTNLVPRRRLAVLADTEPVADLTSPFPPPRSATTDVVDPLHFIGDPSGEVPVVEESP